MKLNEKEINIIMQDMKTRNEAIKHLKNGSIVFSDLEEHFDSYVKEWECDEDTVEELRNMVKTRKPACDWGCVEYEGKWYYIMYVL